MLDFQQLDMGLGNQEGVGGRPGRENCMDMKKEEGGLALCVR
jgi:hypothetical protein